MQLTQTQKLLIYGLNQFSIAEREQETIFLVLQEDADQILMIHYLKTHPQAKEQDIMNHLTLILKQRKKLNEL